MTHRVQWGLMLCCLVLSGFSIGAAAETDGDGGGIFSSILMWFQDRPAEVAPEREDDETDVTPGGETDVTPGGETDATPGGETDATPGGETDATPGGETDATPGGETDVTPGGETDATPGGETDVTPGGETDATPGGETGVTPSHVHQATLDLIAEIEILRRATGVADDPREAEAGEEQSATHAYAKSLEIMEKTARFQKRLGMIPVDVQRMPAGHIAQKDVSRNVRAIIEELRRVKRQLVIEDEIEPAPFAGGKAPSLVYRNLRDASLLLDGLVGRPTNSNDVYANVLRIHDEMELIAVSLKVQIERDPPPIEGARESKDVAQQVLRATYKVVNLQTRLGMDSSDLPQAAMVGATPAEALDATNILLAEMVRIRTHLNIHQPPAKPRESRNKSWSDAFARVLLIVRNLDIMTRAVGPAAD